MGGGSFTTPRAGTPQDIRFTRSKDSSVLYATVLGWPGGALHITTLSSSRIDLSSLRSAQLLGATAGTYLDLPRPIQDSAGLHVSLSASAPFSAPAYVVKLTFAGTIPALADGPGVAAPVVVYVDTGFAGAAAVLPVGTYTAAQLQAAGVASASISSLRVPTGYQVTGYSRDNFTGTAWTFTGDAADLRNTGNNDVILSLKVGFNPSTFFRITNATDGLVLDSGGQVAPGSVLKQWTWDGSPNLQWQLIDLDNGYYRLVNRTNGMVADGFGATAAGASAQQSVWSGSNTQQWQITDQQGRYRIANRATGLVLDGGGQVAIGSVVKQWTWDGSPNLQWTVTPN